MKKPEQMMRLPQDKMKEMIRSEVKSTKEQFLSFWEKVKKLEKH